MLFLLITISCCNVSPSNGDEASAKQLARTPRTFFVTRSLAHERLLPYLRAARPEIAQIGNYGAMFHGYADNPRSTKTPMMLPVVGERAVLKFQKDLNAKVHDLGLRAVGHFRLVKVMADWKEQSGFVEYYNKRWPEDLLGPKPHPDLIELLQRDATGQPLQLSRYDNAQLALCLSSPHARQMLKQMLKCAVDHGIDGVITTYNYHQSCACSHCQNAFRGWLGEKLTPQELAKRLRIKNLAEHKFAVIPAQIPGYPTQDASDLEWLAMEWGAEHFKQMYDDIFISYGRKIRPSLLVAQWNHLSHVSIKEERMFLPRQLWGKDESYFWYSGGASFVRKNLNLQEGKAGDAWLSSLYVRSLSGGRPFVMGKYDGIRLAVSMAEGYALDGLGMGRYMRFENPTGYDVLVRYTNFMHKHRHLFDGAKPIADAALILPRQSVWKRHPEALDNFRSLGQALLEQQVIFDVLPDEAITQESLAKYPHVIVPGSIDVSDEQSTALQQHAKAGRVLAWKSKQIDHAIQYSETPVEASKLMAERIHKLGGFKVTAPWFVRAAAYSQPNRVNIHLVNYNRDESVDKTLQGPELERPRLVKDISLAIPLPENQSAKRVMAFSPDTSGPVELTFEVAAKRISVRVPRLLVYTVISVETQAK